MIPFSAFVATVALEDLCTLAVLGGMPTGVYC